MAKRASRAQADDWRVRPMRIGALQCNYERGRTLGVIDKWVDMGMNVEQLLHPTADDYTALFDERRHGAILKQYVARARKRGLRVILYLNCHIIARQDDARAAEWAQQLPDGTYPRMYDTYYTCCVNSAWRDQFFRVVDSLARYPVDGVFLDGPVLIAGGCRCPSCQARHREWFGSEMGAGPASFEFRWRSLREFLREAYARFKRVRPDGVFYQNLPAAHPRVSGVDLRECLETNDIVGTEGGFMFYGPPKYASMWKPGFAARLLEAVAPRKPRVLFMAGDQKPWSWYQHAAGETAICIASAAANGANVWYGLHGSTELLQTPGGQAARRVFRFMRDHEDLYAGARSAARVAIFHSYETDAAWGGAAEATDLYGEGAGAKALAGKPPEEQSGFVDMTTRSHVPYDVLADLDLDAAALDRYACVILAGAPCMSRETAERLRAYVRRGGHLIGSFTASLHDERGVARKNLELGDVFGVRIDGRITNYRNFNYFVASGRRHPLLAGVDLPLLPAPALALDVRTRSGAVTAARFLKPLAGRYMPLTSPGSPAIVMSRFGKGRALYFAGSFGESYGQFAAPEYCAILANALRMLGRPAVELVAPPSPIEVVARRQGGRLIVHLINGCGVNGRPIERVETQRDLVLRICGEPAGASARALVRGKRLDVLRSGGTLDVCVPVLDEYEVVVVD